MPTIRVKKSRLKKLINPEILDEELKHLLFSIGCEVEEVGENDEWNIEVNASRLDMLMSEGIARAVKGILGIELGIPKYNIVDTGITVIVDPTVKNVRPYVVCAAVYDLNMDEDLLNEIMQFQEKLHITIARNRRKAAIGLHDLDKIKSNTIYYKALPPDKIKFRPLHELTEMTGREILEKTEKGKEYAHLLIDKPLYPLLVTSTGIVLSMPPIINSDYTKIETSTRNIFIDITGSDINTLIKLLDILVTTLAEASKTRKIGLVRVEYPHSEIEVLKLPKLEYTKMVVTVKGLNSIIGLNLDVNDIVKLLRKMRLECRVLDKDKLEVTIPPYRHDIIGEVDIAEDVAIAYGYHNLTPEPPTIYTIGRELPKTTFTRLIRELMVGFGFQEVVTYMLVSRRLQELIVDTGILELENPVVEYMDSIRASLLPSHIVFAAENQYKEHPIKIFEVGDVVVYKDDMVYTETHLAALILSYKVGFEDIHAVLHMLLKNLGLKYKLKPYEHKAFIKGRTAIVVIEGEERGIIGEVNPELLEKLKIVYPIAAFEINLTNLWQRRG
ncbi:MAG TPA: phenylalanine--tRNA ligase subunit beta [Desulfurococcales archaeon]|nr:phenylalanine--tRNA ligase subunit beta [Desulfurococcales archaeon]